MIRKKIGKFVTFVPFSREFESSRMLIFLRLLYPWCLLIDSLTQLCSFTLIQSDFSIKASLAIINERIRNSRNNGNPN